MQVYTGGAPGGAIHSAMPGARVILADDDVLLREGLASLLATSGFEVVAQAGDGDELLSQVRALRPDVVVVDIRMPPTRTTEGLAATRSIRDELPDTAILVLSAHVEVEHAMELLASGERIGYLLKSRVTDVREFIDSLQRITKGGAVIDPTMEGKVKITVIATGFDRPDARQHQPSQTPVDLQHYSAWRQDDRVAAAGGGGGRIAISRRPVLEVPASNASAAAGGAGSEEPTSPLDVPAFLRRQEG